MSQDDDIISLFEGKDTDEPLIQIWAGKITKEVHIMLNGNFLFVLDEKGLDKLHEATGIAKQKLNPI